ncbi:N-6 DNA methylase [Halorientalis salina]|uniref:N-6 DNA methylase n=1 Tax=Halorientalis salina TaxID=2932266 RepID=UPI0010AD086E|nr:N-6 DNA methylase [Halorientalis salina]
MGLLPDEITGELADRYVRKAHEQLADDGPLADAHTAWVEYVRASSGEVFDDLTLPDYDVAPDAETTERVFVRACYFDFLVDSLIDALEGSAGVTLTNRDPQENTDALPVTFGPLHDRIVPPETGRERVRDAVDEPSLRALGPDELRDLYRRVVPREVRLALGEYYTPRGVADLAVDGLDIGTPETTVLDPGCGSGAFLAACIDRKREAMTEESPRSRVDRVTSSIVGIDLNPVAVKSAKLAYCASLFDELTAETVSTVSVPVFLTDALGLMREDDLRFDGETTTGQFDALVGNPPWVPWERLPAAIKDRLREQYVDDLGLQPHGGAAARLGHSNDDLSIPFVWVCIHRYLREGGRASFVLKRDVMRGAAGAVLRGLQVGDRSLSVEHVHDFAALEPFAEVGANAAVYTFEADAEASVPIDTTVWQERDGTDPVYGTDDELRETTRTRRTELRPIDPEDATTAWVRADAERGALGDCAHDIRHGLKDDANAVFGLERTDLDDLEPDLVYPYIKSRHVRKYGLSGHDLRLVPARAAGEDNEAWLSRELPRTYDYLSAHREELLDRSSSWLETGPFYSVFGLGEYTWADYKVAWCRLGFKPDFTVVSTREDPDLGERQVVPGDHYMFIATDHRETAHFLCALLNSATYQRTLRDIASNGKASLSKSVVSELNLPAWPDTETSRRLATLSMDAHEIVRDSSHDGEMSESAQGSIQEIQTEIDGLVEEGLAAGTLV